MRLEFSTRFEAVGAPPRFDRHTLGGPSVWGISRARPTAFPMTTRPACSAARGS
jgi:hypothetical protein